MKITYDIKHISNDNIKDISKITNTDESDIKEFVKKVGMVIKNNTILLFYEGYKFEIKDNEMFVYKMLENNDYVLVDTF